MRISDWSSDVCSSDLRLHILHRMNGRVDVATQKRRIQLLGPQRLAADLGERPVLHAVAGGGKGDKRDFAPAPAARRGERIRHHMRLRKRQRGGARAESARKSVVEGKSVSGRVNFGGGRNI